MPAPAAAPATSGLPAVRWFVPDGHDHRPAVATLPAGLPWSVPGGTAVVADGVLWAPVGEQVVAVRLPGPLAQLAANDTEAIAQCVDGSAVILRGGALHLTGPGERAGADVVLAPHRMGWNDPADPLPEGGARTDRVWPWLLGRGASWADAGYVYHRPVGRPPRAIGHAAASDRLRVGPRGAWLAGTEEEGWTRGGAPGCAALRLSAVISWGACLRWDSDVMLRAISADGTTARVDLRSGRVDVEPSWSPRAPAWALDGALLAGPGARLWDLTTGRAEGSPDLVRDGATVRVRKASRWATVSAHGEGVWFDDSGVVVGTFQIPADKGAVIDGAADGRSARFLTADGRAWSVEDGEVKRSRGDFEPADADVAEPDAELAALGMTAMTQAGGRTWAWSDHGALVSFG